jgi:hypothetical protein
MVPAGIYHSRYATDVVQEKSFGSLTTPRVPVKESIYRTMRSMTVRSNVQIHHGWLYTGGKILRLPPGRLER